MSSNSDLLNVTNKTLTSIFLPLAIGCGLFLVYWLDPITSKLYPPCIFHVLTDLYCAGCGTGRALHSFLHLNWLQAFAYNPLLFVMVVYLGWDKLRRRYQLSEKWHILPRKWQPYREWVIVGIVIMYWVARNLPIYPFTYLSPN